MQAIHTENVATLHLSDPALCAEDSKLANSTIQIAHKPKT